MTPPPTDQRERATDALDRIDELLDRIDHAAQAVLDRYEPTTETHGHRPPDHR